LAKDVVDWVWNQIPTLALFLYGSNITVRFKVRFVKPNLHGFIAIDVASFDDPSIVRAQTERWGLFLESLDGVFLVLIFTQRELAYSNW
jgi:hypothetical protein